MVTAKKSVVAKPGEVPAMRVPIEPDKTISWKLPLAERKCVLRMNNSERLPTEGALVSGIEKIRREMKW